MGRRLSWDRFRGLAILLMVIVNDLATARGIPALLKHAPEVGYTLADLVAPMFIFAMGLTFSKSFQKRYAKDKLDAYMSFIKRNLAFIGLGAIFSGVGIYFAPDAGWGVLQALGVAGLMALAAARLPTLWRALAGLLILAAYQCALAFGMAPMVLEHLHGGFLGALSWGAMLILTTVLIDFYNGDQRKYHASLLLLAACGAAISPVAPISKPLVSASYLLISVALCGALLSLADLIEKRLHLEERRDFLCDWGENPLALYLAHYALIGILHLPNLFFDPPVWMSLIRTAVMLALLNQMARTFHRKNIRISL